MQRRHILVLGVIFALLVGCGRETTPAPTPMPTVAPATRTVPPPTAVATETVPAVSAPRPYRLKPGELILAAEQDAIPALFADDTVFVSAAAGDEEWTNEEPVIGVELDGDARAYPVRLLSLHEIVNDTVGGRPVAVTWCPLCYSAITFDRVVEGRQLTFGVSGYLLHSNLVMYDHQTNTLWSQLLGQGVRGAHARTRLDIVSSELTTWGAWKDEHPDTQVLSAAQLDQHEDEVVDPYSGYYSSGVAGLLGGDVDPRLPPKSLVVGLAAGTTFRAYPLQTIREEILIHDVIGGFPILVGFDAALETAFVYRRRVDDRVLTFEPAQDTETVRDIETGTTWDLQGGRAIEGDLAGTQLERLNAPLVFWFAWAAYHPDTDIYAED